MNTITKQAIMGVMAVVGLSACQKSACDYTPDGNRVLAANQMQTCLSSMPATLTADMPTSGSASFQGFLTAAVSPASGPSDNLYGNASLSANFTGAGGTVTGNVTGITSTLNGDLGSNLAITGGTITTNIVSGAAINGTLTGYGSQSITVGGTLAGGFLGEGANGLLLATGAITPAATVTFSGGGSGTADLTVFGLR